MFITGAVLSTTTSTRLIGTPSWRNGSRGTSEAQRGRKQSQETMRPKPTAAYLRKQIAIHLPNSWSIISRNFVWNGCSEDQVTECHTCSSLLSRAAIMNPMVNITFVLLILVKLATDHIVILIALNLPHLAYTEIVSKGADLTRRLVVLGSV